MHNSEQVPFLNLRAPHADLKQELTAVFQRALEGGMFVGGPMVDDFESAFARFCETRHAVGANSGTDALRFALMAAGITRDQVVVTVPHTFIATTEAISQAGAIPEFVDVDELTYNLSVDALQEYVESRCFRDARGRLISRRYGKPVTAIVPVHLYGQMADMDAILGIAEENGLAVIEDACQAHGAEYFSRRQNRWMKAGSMGAAAAFSFYPGKNLGACGEAGAITTNNAAIAQACRRLASHGQTTKYFHETEGYNGRLDAIQAGLLEVKLSRLAEWNAARRERAAEYNRLLAAERMVVCPYEPAWSRSVYHLYVIRTADRDALMRHLAGQGIGTGIHYPVPLHMQQAYAWMGYAPGDFPVAARLAAEIVSLPMFPQLRREQQSLVVKGVSQFASSAQYASLPSAMQLAPEVSPA